MFNSDEPLGLNNLLEKIKLIDMLFQPLALAHGPALKSRFMLAPMTNQQSHADGRLSDDEIQWLSKRAAGGFALTMTAAAQVQPVGRGFPGQLGIFSDDHLEGLARLARRLRQQGSLSAVQLHHAGDRAPPELVGTPVGPSTNPESGSRGLSLLEVERLRDDFIIAAGRADKAGFDGIEVHGAHGYILAQFLSPSLNRRNDCYGGSLENRSRLLFEIIEGIRRTCRPDFQVGLRLSPERFGMSLAEMRDIAMELLRKAEIDYLDLSLWDVFKEPEEQAFKGRSLLSYFAELPRGNVRLGAAGNILSAESASAIIDAGCDFAIMGRAAILHHDVPKRVRNDPGYVSPALPVTEQHLRAEAVGTEFVNYLRGWPSFVAEKEQHD